MIVALARYDVYGDFFSASKDKSAIERFASAKTKVSGFQAIHHAGEVYPDLSSIEHEAAALYQVFLDSRHDAKKLKDSGLIEMLAFSSQLLLMHYQSYPKKKEIALHQGRLDTIEHFINDTKLPSQEKKEIKNRFEWVILQVTESFSDLWSLLCNPALLRDQLGWTNLARIFWIFYHFSINEMILIVKDAPILDKIGRILGAPVDLDAFYALLNTPNDFLNILSVAFFGIRLVIDVIMLAKHTISDETPTLNQTDAWQRFCAELDKRSCNITNCIVWGGVNAATNYSSFFGIPVQFAMPIVAGVLIFDLSLALVLWRREDQSYQRALTGLTEKIMPLEDKLNSLTTSEKEYLKVLNMELHVLKEKRIVSNEVFKFNSLAALLMVSSFSVSLLVAPPLAILACYIVCCFSLSLYSCAAPGEGDYAKYLTASRNLAYAQSQNGQFTALELQALADKSNQAYTHLQAVILERALVPLVLLALLAINPILGLSAVAAYTAYKITEGFNKHVEVKEPEVALNQFSLFPPAAEGGAGGASCIELSPDLKETSGMTLVSQ